ncbi:MAG: RES family NAD+ phosphorylase [Deinococcales bacterium]
MVVWRIASRRHAASAFGDEGAGHTPGRWDHRGRCVVYASVTPSLAALEILAKAETASALDGRLAIRADLPDDAVYALPTADLPANWDANPIGPGTRDVGEAWCADAVFLALAVPSAVMPLQQNIVINQSGPR